MAWGSAITDYFSAVNGVKQGAVLSPVLFCVYMDDLLSASSKAGVGCYIGCTFVGALAYADDIVLTAPTATAMRNLLKKYVIIMPKNIVSRLMLAKLSA